MKTVLGVILWIVMGFSLFVLCSWFGVAIGIIVTQFPWWLILLGTVAGCAACFELLLKEEKK